MQHPVAHRVCRRCLRAIAAAAGFLLLAATAVQAQEAGDCTVTRLRGPASVLRDGGSIRLVSGAALRSDDQLVTGDRALLRLACPDGIDVTVGADSTVSLRFLTETGTASRSLFYLIHGILRIALAPRFARERVELRTPTAVAAARSTAWIAEASARNTAIFVIEGDVAVRSLQTGEAVLVPATFGTDVAVDAAPTPPVRWGRPRAEAALRRTDFP